MKLLMLTLIIMLPAFANAQMEIFAGIGLTGGQTQFDVTEPTPNVSKFTTLGYLVESGIKMGTEWGLQASGEMGKLTSNNNLASQTYLEAANVSFYTAKGGLHFSSSTRSYGFGLGARLSEWNVKSVSTDTNTFTEIKYKGVDTLVYGQLSFDINNRYRTTIEGQYITGKLTAPSSGISNLKYSEMLFSLRFLFLFN